jgi:hypothetical protein
MNNVTTKPPASVLKPRRLRRWLLRLAIASAFLCLAVAAYVFYFAWSAERRLEQAIAQLDRRDPGWRLEELEAHRKVIPPDENSAFQIRKVLGLKTGPWPGEQPRFDEVLWELSPPVSLPQRDAEALRGELMRSQPALVEARKLADLPNGRFPIGYSSDVISTLLPDVLETRNIAHLLLRCDVLLQCQDGNMELALADCRAMLNAARSLNDEPLLISQLIRLACRNHALHSIEHVLAQGEPSDKSLALLQQLLEAEDKEPVFLIAARGERAFSDKALQAAQSEKAKSSQLGTLLTKALQRLKAGDLDFNDLLYQVFGSISADRVALLKYLSEIVEIAKLPVEEQDARLKQLESGLAGENEMVQSTVMALTRAADGIRRSQAALVLSRVLQ